MRCKRVADLRAGDKVSILAHSITYNGERYDHAYLEISKENGIAIEVFDGERANSIFISKHLRIERIVGGWLLIDADSGDIVIEIRM